MRRALLLVIIASLLTSVFGCSGSSTEGDKPYSGGSQTPNPGGKAAQGAKPLQAKT